MEMWRLLPTDEINDYYHHMAVDEAVLNAVSQDLSSTTLRFYRWNRPAVSIGYFQAVTQEVNINNCQKDNVAIFRRMTGGGAVYKDPLGELNYSLIIKESHPMIPSNIQKSYHVIQQGIIKGLEELGLNANMAGINDIILEGKKISGNAQTRKNGVLLQHGTLLLDFDVNKMIKYLNIPLEKISDKKIAKIEDRVGTLKTHLPSITFSDLEKAIKTGFTSTFKIKLGLDRVNNAEKALAKQLKNNKYATKEWTYWR